MSSRSSSSLPVPVVDVEADSKERREIISSRVDAENGSAETKENDACGRSVAPTAVEDERKNDPRAGICEDSCGGTGDALGWAAGKGYGERAGEVEGRVG